MPENPAYLDAEARVFRRFGLTPNVRTLSPKLAATLPPARLRVAEVGSGEPVLFLHGWGGLCTATWAPLVANLPGVRSLMLDLPGHGTSDAVDFRGVDLRRWFDAMLKGCLDELGLESVHVVGHSQGAMFALWLALGAPERVRSVVAIGVPAVAFGARIEALRFLARPGLGPLLLWLPVPQPSYRRILAGTMGRTAVRDYPDLVRATYLATHRSGFATTTSTEMREMFRGADAQPPRYALGDDELGTVARPVQVLWGEDDTHFQAIAEARARAELMPHSSFEVVAGEHTPWLDDPEACASRMGAMYAR
jgi:pimeloyl-ACP methyl ester carboxylesterase